jgi:prolyl-tRNA editing enzyme YbaK/EbsC (Cys-tRNA(Pro) deacylase)
MAEIVKRLHELLDDSGVEYEIIHHRQDVTAEQTAADTHTPKREFAKTVFVWIDGQYALAVLPATHFVSVSKLERSLGASEVRLASEFEMGDLCLDCEVGAAPPSCARCSRRTSASPSTRAPTRTRCACATPTSSDWSSRRSSRCHATKKKRALRDSARRQRMALDAPVALACSREPPVRACGRF